MLGIFSPSYLSRKSLLFLCLSVASAVFFFASPAFGATTTDNTGGYAFIKDGTRIIGDNASSTSFTLDVDCSLETVYEVFADDCMQGDIWLDYGDDDLDTTGQYLYALFAVDSFDNLEFQYSAQSSGGAGSFEVGDYRLVSYADMSSNEMYMYQIDLEFISSPLSYMRLKQRDHSSESRNLIGAVISSTNFNLAGIDTYNAGIDLLFSLSGDDTYAYSSSSLSTYASGFNSTYETRFTDIAITDLEPLGPPPPVHAHVQIDVDYWLEESEIDVNVSERNPTQVKFSYALRPSTTTNGDFTTISATSYGSGSTTIDFADLADGTYDLLVQFSNIGASLGLSPQPFSEAYIYTSFTILDQNLTATGTPEYYNKQNPDETNKYLDCSLTQIDNCLKNVGIFLFYPSEDSLDNFYTLQESIDQKFPFNYISDFKDAFTGFYTTATTQSMTLTVPFGTFGDITLISADLINDVPLASTIRTILGYLLWVMLVYQIYRRTLRIFNSQETTA